MEVTSDRRHRFDVDRAQLWEAMASPADYRRWWPWLRRFEGDRLEPGAVWACTVQPPLPYVLRFELTIEEVVPLELITATVAGDLRGTARLEVRDLGAGDGQRSEIRLRSSLAPTNRVLQAFARVANPVVRYGHDWVLDTGLRQFRTKGLSDGRATGGP
jgi:hypothetical protein